MSERKDDHPYSGEMGIFEGYGEYDEMCGHIAIYVAPDGTQQCKDCLRKWPAKPGSKPNP